MIRWIACAMCVSAVGCIRASDLTKPSDTAVEFGVVSDSDIAVDRTDFATSPDLQQVSSPDLLLPVDLNSCVQTLANVGSGDFTMRLILTATPPATWFSTVLYQRDVTCNDRSKDYWVLFLGANGRLRMTMNEGNGAYTALDCVAVAGDGKPHKIVVQRRSGSVGVLVDGAFDSAAQFPELQRALPALRVAKGDSCEAPGGTTPLNGTVTDICITIP